MPDASNAGRLLHNHIAPAMRADGTEVIRKIGASSPEFTTEIEALRVYDGRGSVKPLDVDRDQGRTVNDRESDAPSSKPII